MNSTERSGAQRLVNPMAKLATSIMHWRRERPRYRLRRNLAPAPDHEGTRAERRQYLLPPHFRLVPEHDHRIMLSSPRSNGFRRRSPSLSRSGAGRAIEMSAREAARSDQNAEHDSRNRPIAEWPRAGFAATLAAAKKDPRPAENQSRGRRAAWANPNGLGARVSKQNCLAQVS